MKDRILKKAILRKTFNRKEIKEMLSIGDRNELSMLFAAARAARQSAFGNSIFLYGFLYFSTHCRNNCRFCQYRQENTALKRYRKSSTEIIRAAREMARTGVHLIDLTMGEDPEFRRLGFQSLVDLVREVKLETGLPLMISPGVIPDEVIRELVGAGAQWLACYQETNNRELYAELRPGQDYDLRMAIKKSAAEEGMLVEEGMLTGTGETLDDLAESITTMQEQDFDQVRVMTFVPQAGTTMAGITMDSRLMEKKVIAIMRLVMPDRLIPASLDVDGLDGLKDRLDAGANVVTSIVPPSEALAGVANNSLDIEDSRRTVSQVSEVLEDCGLSVASNSQYDNWLRRRLSEHRASVSASQRDRRGRINTSRFQPLECPTHAIH